MFRGEETGNAGYLDLGKLQLCYCTIALVLAYAEAAALNEIFVACMNFFLPIVTHISERFPSRRRAARLNDAYGLHERMPYHDLRSL